MREGFTTGSCAAAAALACCLWQKGGTCPARVALTLPGGRVFAPAVIAHEDGRCSVVKDAGDDPDITDGCQVCARVTLGDGPGPVTFAAGEGVGTVTQPGLKVAVGEPAINPVPRRMIQAAVRQVFPTRRAVVEISIPGGAALARRTFNPRLGIEGGLSVLGTTGVVRPMSQEALTQSIHLEMRMRRAQGTRHLALAFGSQGERALAVLHPGTPCALISNFVGFALDSARALGFHSVLLAGQPGKLVKVAGGCMQTHSRCGDGRREALICHLALMGAGTSLVQKVWAQNTLEGAIPLLREANLTGVWDALARQARLYCQLRAGDALHVETLIVDAGGGLLGRSGPWPPAG